MSLKLSCSICQYFTNSNSHLNQHFLSKKHIRNVSYSSLSCVENSFFQKQCTKCHKNYKSQSGLWKHSVKCRVSHLEAAIGETTELNLVNEIKELKDIIKELVNSRPVAQTNSTINNNNNTNFNINVFLNETCKNAINLDSFIKNLIFELADPKLMIGNYVDGTCNILRRNLDGLPLDKRPLHCMEGEDPNQQLMHIRQDDKWNIGTYVNWLEQIYADDDDDVVEKNPIYYALKKIDEEKLKYLGYNFNDNDDYKIQHGRLNRETSRQDLKKDVYNKLLKMITLEPDSMRL